MTFYLKSRKTIKDGININAVLRLILIKFLPEPGKIGPADSQASTKILSILRKGSAAPHNN